MKTYEDIYKAILDYSESLNFFLSLENQVSLV